MSRRPDLRVLQTTDGADAGVSVIYNVGRRAWLGGFESVVPIRSWFGVYYWHANGSSSQTRYVGASVEAVERLRQVIFAAWPGVERRECPRPLPSLYQPGDEPWGHEVADGEFLWAFIDPVPRPERFPVRRSALRRLLSRVRGRR